MERLFSTNGWFFFNPESVILKVCGFKCRFWENHEINTYHSCGDVEAAEPGRGFSFWAGRRPCQHSQHRCAYLRNAESPLSAGHGTQCEMTITTKVKYDCKCHVPPDPWCCAASRHASVTVHRVDPWPCPSVSEHQYLLSAPQSSLRSTLGNQLVLV